MSETHTTGAPWQPTGALEEQLRAYEQWTDHFNGPAPELAWLSLEDTPLDGIDLRSRRLDRINLSEASLNSANFDGACLASADLSHASLRGACLLHAQLPTADVTYADLAGADLRGADLRGARLLFADLSGADLAHANLSDANLIGANLTDANLTGARLSGVTLREANLSGCRGWETATDFLAQMFEATADGYLVYKTFGSMYDAPASWVIAPGSELSEIVNPDRGLPCGCGINVAPLAWVRCVAHKDRLIWRCLLKWRDLADTIVPYGSDGKIRCGRITLLETVE